MKAIGTTIIVSEIKEEIKNKLGLIITESNDKTIRYKLGEVFLIGDEIKDIKVGDKLYYDKANASDLRLHGEKYVVINLSSVKVIL